MCADAPSSHRPSAILSPRVCHCISRRHFMSSSAIHQQSTIWTSAHTSEVRWTLVLVCRTKSLEVWNGLPSSLQDPTDTKTFKRKLNIFLFQQAYNWTYVVLSRSFLFLCYYATRYVIRWSILFCKRNSLWTMNYEALLYVCCKLPFVSVKCPTCTKTTYVGHFIETNGNLQQTK